jgi:hypothetical protein
VSEAPTPAGTFLQVFLYRLNYACKSVPTGNGSICDVDEEEDAKEEDEFLFLLLATEATAASLRWSSSPQPRSTRRRGTASREKRGY